MTVTTLAAILFSAGKFSVILGHYILYIHTSPIMVGNALLQGLVKRHLTCLTFESYTSITPWRILPECKYIYNS